MKIFRDYLLTCAEQPTFPTASNSTRSINPPLFRGFDRRVFACDRTKKYLFLQRADFETFTALQNGLLIDYSTPKKGAIGHDDFRTARQGEAGGL